MPEILRKAPFTGAFLLSLSWVADAPAVNDQGRPPIALPPTEVVDGERITEAGGAAFPKRLAVLGSSNDGRALRADSCRPPPNLEQARVKSVLDGDTLRLRKGGDVRLIGLDTPELGRDGNPDMPGAREAGRALRRLVRQTGNRIYLQQGRQHRDRYGRLLAHVFTQDGESLTRRMLSRGLGYQIALPPNLRYLVCYREAEAKARREGLGVWREPVRQAVNLRAGERGFRLLQGEVERIGRAPGALWLNLRGGLAIRIAREDLAAFGLPDLAGLVGRRLEARGWLYRYRGEQRLRIRHPSALRWL